MTFVKGQSGNPAGRPAGSRNKASLAADELIAAEAQGFMRRIIERGRAGDMEAIKFVLDRVYPRPRDRSINFELSPIDTPEDVRSAMKAVLVAMASGELTPKEAADVMKVIEAAGRVLEVVAAAEERLARMEQAMAKMAASSAEGTVVAANQTPSPRGKPTPPLAKTSEIQPRWPAEHPQPHGQGIATTQPADGAARPPSASAASPPA